jgi:predicted aconitase
MPLHLTDQEQAMLGGHEGPAVRMAMSVVLRLGEIVRADRLVEVSSCHIDSCLYHGQAGLDFALRLAELGGRVRVPTTLNVALLDLVHPELFRGDDGTRQAAQRLTDAYVAMGCAPTWTCAPYQLPNRPSLGQDIAWAESNAITFANSVLGARTERYGDFIDICAAITGRVPRAGLHIPENRHADLVFDLRGIDPPLLDQDITYPILGHILGQRSGVSIPAIIGSPASTSEDRLKNLGAAAASSGGVPLFHAVGVTPEAPTLEAATGGTVPAQTIELTTTELRAARRSLGPVGEGQSIDAVSVGTPHFSLAELEILVRLVDELAPSLRTDFYLSTHRAILSEADRRGWVRTLESAGVTFVADTCTYITSILRPDTHVVMTDSAKWAYYAPGNLGVQVAFGSLLECVLSAEAGRVVFEGGWWDAA